MRSSTADSAVGTPPIFCVDTEMLEKQGGVERIGEQRAAAVAPELTGATIQASISIETVSIDYRSKLQISGVDADCQVSA